MFNYSFWADEAYIAGIALQLITGKISFQAALDTSGVFYQKIYMLMLALSLKIFGFSEFAARVPSIFFYAIGIAVIFLLVKKIANVYAAILSTFFYAFSHLNLAYATQAKPYIIIELLTLLVLFLIVYASQKPKKMSLLLSHAIIIFLTSSALLVHNIGIFLWVLYGAYLVSKLTTIKINKRVFVLSIPIILVLTFIAYKFIYPVILSFIFLLFKEGQLFPYNHAYQVAKLFGFKYFFLTACAVLGYLGVFKKNIAPLISLAVYSTVLLFMVAFEFYTFNIRYVLSLFGILFAFSGIGLANIIKVFFPRQVLLGTMLAILLIYVSGYKISRIPQAYYNPNVDKYGDIQIANYKDFYTKLKQNFPNYRKFVIVNDTHDVEYWYMRHYSSAYFTKFVKKPYRHQTGKAMVYGSLVDFKKFIVKHPRGLLIMEDWESFLPEDIKQYAKENLKLEFRVESLKEAPEDPWPLALYSWGL